MRLIHFSRRELIAYYANYDYHENILHASATEFRYENFKTSLKNYGGEVIIKNKFSGSVQFKTIKVLQKQRVCNLPALQVVNILFWVPRRLFYARYVIF